MSKNEPRLPADTAGKADGAPVPLWSVVKSIAAAAFGVQSSSNKERDFAQGNYRHFIVGGIVFTLLFVLTVVVVVRMVLHNAG